MEVFVYDKQRRTVVGRKNVPVIMAPKEKVISVLSVVDGVPKPEIDNVLPKISIIWTGSNWDSIRQTGNKVKRRLGIEYNDESGRREKAYRDIQTVPYKFDLQVTLWTKYMDEGVQLLENILPFFDPDLHISVYERITGQERKSQVILTSVTPNFVYELNEPDRRILQWDLNFTMEVNLYKPVEFDQPIEEAFINIAGVNDRAPNSNYGDMVYVTTDGVSGQINDDNIRSVIIGFDEIENNYTDSAIESMIDSLNIMKLDEINQLPVSHTEDDVKEITDIYDDSIRLLGYDPRSWTFNSLQFRQSKIDSIDYKRVANITDKGILTNPFPKFYEDGYQSAFDALTDGQKIEAQKIKVKYDRPMNSLIIANRVNVYINEVLMEQTEPPMTPGISERSAENNYKLERLG